MDNGELRLSKFITKLTGITEEDIANKAIPIYHAFEKLVEFAKVNKAQRVAQWGGGDLEELLIQYEDAVINAPVDQFNPSRIRQFIGEGMNNTITAISPIDHKLTNPINIKHMFQLHQDSRKRPYRGGLDASIRRLGGKFEGDAHDALIDSINTAKVLELMYEEPKKDKESLVEAIRGLYRGEVVPGYSGLTEIILKEDLEKLLKEIL
jgi:inhibitor of KinA sporulation pathway (predicted exonuclease)